MSEVPRERIHRGLVASILALALLLPAAAGARPLARDGGPRLSAQAVLVLKNKTGKALLARNDTEVRSIASLTKLMAALVVIDRGLKLDKGTVINREDHKVALKGCRTRLELNWTYSNRDLLHAALMASDNRAVSALGRAVGLHANALVQAMNERARRMGLRKTSFKGPVGIDPGNKSTTWEMSRIVRETSRVKVLSQIMAKKLHRVKPMKGYLKPFYRNTNPLVGKFPGVHFIATKTGYNHVAGYSIAAVAKVRGFGELTFVLLGCKRKADRPKDIKKIIRWLRSGGRQKNI